MICWQRAESRCQRRAACAGVSCRPGISRNSLFARAVRVSDSPSNSVAPMATDRRKKLRQMRARARRCEGTRDLLRLSRVSRNGSEPPAGDDGVGRQPESYEFVGIRREHGRRMEARSLQRVRRRTGAPLRSSAGSELVGGRRLLWISLHSVVYGGLVNPAEDVALVDVGFLAMLRDVQAGRLVAGFGTQRGSPIRWP